MVLTFDMIITLIADLFGGSVTLAGLAMLIVAWMVCAVICLNLKAGPAYSVVPLIPLAIFFTAYGILDETIMLLIIIVTAALVAAEFRRAV